MTGEKKSWAVRAQELLDEQARERLRPGERVRERLSWEDWESLRGETVAFAAHEIGRRKWRGALGGVLPEGADAEDVADQAIAELLSGKGRLAVGWVRSRLVQELKRQVSQRVRVLQARKETATTRSEWEMVTPDEDGAPVSALNLIEDPGASTDEAVAEREADADRKKAQRTFEEWLGAGDLRWVFRCLCAGVTKPGEIARLLAIEEKEVAKLRKRLERRMARYRKAMAAQRSGASTKTGGAD